MRKINVKLALSFQPFLDRAHEIIKVHGYENEDPIKVAMHQAAIHQDAAFEKALDLIHRSHGYNVSVEPIELQVDNNIVIYEASLILPSNQELLEDRTIYPPAELIAYLKDNFKPTEYTIL